MPPLSGVRRASARWLVRRASSPKVHRMLDPGDWEVIEFAARSRPRLVVLVDAEEEFDWAQPFSRAKLLRLVAAIEDNLGVRPTSFTAGRYGVGASTQGLLEELGFRIDSSVRPYTEYLEQGGPDFRHCGAKPYWVGPAAHLPDRPPG